MFLAVPDSKAGGAQRRRPICQIGLGHGNLANHGAHRVTARKVPYNSLFVDRNDGTQFVVLRSG